jgi:hypothetical protein
VRRSERKMRRNRWLAALVFQRRRRRQVKKAKLAV